MRPYVLFLLAIIALSFLANANARIISHRHDGNLPRGVHRLSRALPTEMVKKFTILLRHSPESLELFNSEFEARTTPGSSKYGQHLTKHQVSTILASSKTDIKTTVDWLLEASKGEISLHNLDISSDHIRVKNVPVSAVEHVFNTQMFYYLNTRGNKVLRTYGTASVPIGLAKTIEFVSGLSEFHDNTRYRPTFYTSTRAAPSAAADPIITPFVLRDFYQVPTHETAQASNVQGILAFEDFYSKGALTKFDHAYNSTGTISKVVGVSCLTDGCDEVESDLDVQYITSMGTNVASWFIGHADNEWILEAALGLQSMGQIPLVLSISYGWSELDQCEDGIGGTACTKYGYDSQQYVARCNIEIQKVTAVGTSIFVSSGDDGAPSYYGTVGNNPLDGSEGRYCVNGGCTYKSSKCTSIIVKAGTSTCVYPGGAGTQYGDCETVMGYSYFQTALTEFTKANAACKFATDQDNDGNQLLYSECECSAMTAYKTTKVSVTPYTVFDPTIGPALVPDFPTSSPFVTSVGATQFVPSSATPGAYDEVVASIATPNYPSHITGGGGFSFISPQPSWQSDAVSAYLTSGVALPPSNTFNASGRAYPDLAGNGHNYIIEASDDGTDKCPCSQQNVDGTSCSSPMTAGIFSLINDELIAAGKSPLGFANPTLYQIFASTPDAFNDVTVGDVKCNRNFCFDYGFEAAKGWDAASGLGSVNYPKLLAAVFKLKGAN